MAGWLTSVAFSRSAGPRAQISRRSSPRIAAASSNSLRAAGRESHSAWPMPTACAPWPGKRNAIRGMAMIRRPSLVLAPRRDRFEFADDDVVQPGPGVLGGDPERVLDRPVAGTAV